jgi:hypothetical protein
MSVTTGNNIQHEEPKAPGVVARRRGGKATRAPLSEQFAQIEQKVTAEFLLLDPRERAILAQRLHNMFTSAKVRTTTPQRGDAESKKTKSSKAPAVQKPDNREFNCSAAAQVGAHCSKLLSAASDSTPVLDRGRAYILSRAVLSVRAAFKNARTSGVKDSPDLAIATRPITKTPEALLSVIPESLLDIVKDGNAGSNPLWETPGFLEYSKVLLFEEGPAPDFPLGEAMDQEDNLDFEPDVQPVYITLAEPVKPPRKKRARGLSKKVDVPATSVGTRSKRLKDQTPESLEDSDV